MTGLAVVLSIVDLSPVVGSFSDSHFFPGLVHPLIHLLSASIASGDTEKLSWHKKDCYRPSLRSCLPRGKRPGRRLLTVHVEGNTLALFPGARRSMPLTTAARTWASRSTGAPSRTAS